jgi:hypothetical protein
MNMKTYSKIGLKKWNVLFLILICCVFLSHAQKRVTYNNQQWLQYYNQLQITKKITLFSDVSFRRIDYFNKWSQMSFRTGIGYPITPQINGVTGFAYFTFYTNDNLSRIEFRPYQEINTRQKFEKFSIQHRSRAEFRCFQEVVNKEITAIKFQNFRFRYRLYATIPIVQLSDKKTDRKILLNIGDEIFISAGGKIGNNMLLTNRILFGPVFQFNDNLNISFTYNYQYVQLNTQSTYEHSDVFWIGINHRLSLVKK